MGLAHYASLRSHDVETKVGCVIVNTNNHVVSMGYNGFPAGCNDDEIPTTRPLKYPYMVHAEENAVSNIISRKDDGFRAYITHFPCHGCAKLLWQNNIKKWYINRAGRAHSSTDDDDTVYNFLLKNGLKVDTMDMDGDLFKYIQKIQSGIK